MAIARTEARQYLKGSLLLSGIFGLLTIFFLAVFPAFKDEAELLEAAMPEHMFTLIGFEEIHTIEGYTAGYIIALTWILFFGIYIAYLGGGIIARDIQSRKMDLTLSYPVSRGTVLGQKMLALMVPIGLISAIFAVVLFFGVRLIGETLAAGPLLLLFVLSWPYLLVCAGIGLLFSVTLKRVETAQIGALGVVFLLWLLDGLSALEEDFEWVGDIAPTRYYDPNEILIDETYAFSDATILLVAFFGLVGLSWLWFVRRDL